MANPRYHDDPDWYERPGETVHLEVDQKPAHFTMPALPWAGRDVATYFAQCVAALPRPVAPCVVCGKSRDVGAGGLCGYCARAQAADECAKARANAPQPTRPRIQIREAWESWSLARPTTPDPSPTIREYETRLD